LDHGNENGIQGFKNQVHNTLELVSKAEDVANNAWNWIDVRIYYMENHRDVNQLNDIKAGLVYFTENLDFIGDLCNQLPGLVDSMDDSMDIEMDSVVDSVDKTYLNDNPVLNEVMQRIRSVIQGKHFINSVVEIQGILNRLINQ